ncbi:MAG: single-stranded DNA-binding protein [Defluviitaleaceae bacterium]|nr:single-stranded DNA-binding protein [Defluviitaleaceae bacterium]
MNLENPQNPNPIATVNRISLFGEIASECTFSHDVFGEGFYNFNILVPRLSDASDLLPVTISERIIEGSRFAPGEHIGITGQIRSYNNYVEEEGRNRLILTVFAKDYEFYDDQTTASHNPNEVFLDGFICKPPIYRTTPFGREIADLLLAVNRSYNKSDYIPCITWGRNARYGAKLAVGDNIKLWGRMQSRIYQKKQEHTDEVLEKTAFEVSVSRLEYATVPK